MKNKLTQKHKKSIIELKYIIRSNKMKIKNYHVYLIITVLITIFIFSNSMKTANVSSQMSGGIVAFVCKLFNIGQEHHGFVVHIVRKLAHMTEFFAQGFSLTMFFYAQKKKPLEFFVLVLFTGLLTACTDEFIQLFFDGRSGEITDVWIDFGGTSIALILCIIFNKFSKKGKTS